MLLHENDPKRLQSGLGEGGFFLWRVGGERKGSGRRGFRGIVNTLFIKQNKNVSLKIVAAKVTKMLTGVNAKRKIMWLCHIQTYN